MNLVFKRLVSVLISASILISCQGKKSEAPVESPAASTPAPVTENTAANTPSGNMVAGKKTFETYCILCHGADGKLGLNGSKDLSISTITLEERINQVTNGKGVMTPFKDILTEAEIRDVAEYTQLL